MALKPLVPADLTSMMEAGYSPAQQRAAGLNVGSPYGDQTFIQPVIVPVPQKSGVASLQDMYEQKRDVYRSILGDPEEQRSAAQSQALFTIANFGLQLAGATGGRVGASFGEKLAQAAQGSQLFPSISAISQQQREAQQKFDLAALQAAETERAAALKAEQERRTAAAKPQKPDYKTLVSADGQRSLGVFDVSTAAGREDFGKAQAANPGSFPGTPEIKDPKTTTYNPEIFNVFTTDEETGGRVRLGQVDLSTEAGQQQRAKFEQEYPGAFVEKIVTPSATPSFVTVVDAESKPLGTFNQNTTEGQRAIERLIAENPGASVDTAFRPDVISDSAFFNRFGVTKAEFEVLPEEDQRRLRGLDEKAIKGIPFKIFNALSREEQKVIMGLREGERVRTLGDRIVKTNLDGTTVTLFSLPAKPIYKKMEDEIVEIIPGEDGAAPTTRVVYEQEIAEGLDPEYRIIFNTETGTEQYVDISTTAGRAAVNAANAANATAQGTVFELRTVPTQQQKPAKAYLLEDQNKIVLSYDGGRTYTDEDGQPKNMPTTGAVPVSDTIAYQVAKNARIRAVAGQQLDAIAQEFIALGIDDLRLGDKGAPLNLSGEQKSLVKDAVRAALDGTGPWARLGVAVNAITGGVAGIEFFPDTPDNRNYLKAIRILGRSALVVNPKFPVAEMQQVGALFPDEEAFFVSPEAEARKLVTLKRVATEQLAKNLSRIASGTLNEGDRDATMTNNNEIRRLLGLLETVPLDPSATGSGAAKDAWRRMMNP